MSLISTVQQVISPKEDKNIAKAALVDLNDNGSLNNSTYRTFQYFPETISDTRSSEWQAKNVIGGSHPIYQWIYGSGREISFEATFTRDYMSVKSDGSLNSTLNLIDSAIKNPIGTAISLVKNGGSTNNEGDYTVKMEGAIAWLRSKTYPSYPNRIAKAPPKMLLVLPGTGIFSGAKVDQAKTIDSIPVIMTSCNVTYEAFFRTGEPRVVTVAVSFAEIIQTSSPGWGFVDGVKSMNPLWQKAPFAYTRGSVGNGKTNVGRSLVPPGSQAGTPSPNPLSTASGLISSAASKFA
jgi:hypothetical protein